MNEKLRRFVRRRAQLRCEYCGLSEADARTTTHHVEHIVARKHRGPTRPSNLALARHRCNFLKGTDLSGVDPRTGKLTKLFDPRRHCWKHHFRWDGFEIIGRTAIGRTTIEVLGMNDNYCIRLRRSLAESGRFPW